MTHYRYAESVKHILDPSGRVDIIIYYNEPGKKPEFEIRPLEGLVMEHQENSHLDIPDAQALEGILINIVTKLGKYPRTIGHA